MESCPKIDSLENYSILPNFMKLIRTYAGNLRELSISHWPRLRCTLFPALLGIIGGLGSSTASLERVRIMNNLPNQDDVFLEAESIPAMFLANRPKLISLVVYSSHDIKVHTSLQEMVDTPWISYQLDNFTWTFWDQ